jgi:hypothetical protein
MPELPPDRPLPCEPQNNSNHVEPEEDNAEGEPDRQVFGHWCSVWGFQFVSFYSALCVSSLAFCNKIDRGVVNECSWNLVKL